MSTLSIEAGMVFDDLGELGILIDEDGGGDQDAGITTGSFFHKADATSATGPHPSAVSDFSDLETAIFDAWDGFTSGTPTVTFDRSAGAWTLSATGLTTLDITLNTLAQQVLGFSSGTLTGALSYTSTRTPYYWIDTVMGCRTDSSLPYDGGPDPAADTYGHDGTPGGVSKDGTSKWWDWACSLEGYQAIWKIHATAATPWTWEHFFEHCRNEYPFAVFDGTDTWFHYLRAEGSKFKPLKLAADYYGEADIRLLTKYVGTV